MKHTYKILGVMSGTSLDGLDIACCRFTLKGKKWKFKILQAETFAYSDQWKNSLATVHTLPGDELMALHVAFGKLIGEHCARFIKKEKLRNIDWISSHGHTVFHQTQRQLTFQLGEGNAIFASARVPVIYDFRSLDVALKGQGAPLVPIGDRLLFRDYDVCINLGGIANLSLEKNEKRIAYDVCYANMGLNYLAAKAGKAFDDDGAIAGSGHVDVTLLKNLGDIYKGLQKKPALGREGFEMDVRKLLDNESLSTADRMCTFCESIAREIVRCIPNGNKKMNLLVTGGGAHNSYLIALLQSKLTTRAEIRLPSRQIIDFKEALVFAFLGVLRLRGEVNVLKSVTRATSDSCSGSIVGR